MEQKSDGGLPPPCGISDAALARLVCLYRNNVAFTLPDGLLTTAFTVRTTEP